MADTIDGHISRINREFLRTVSTTKYCLPAFHPIQCISRNPSMFRFFSVENGYLHKTFWKGNFYTLLAEAQKIAFTTEKIRSSIWHTGLGNTFGLRNYPPST